MKDSDIILEAIEIQIRWSSYSCNAIEKAAQNKYNDRPCGFDLSREYSQLFKPEEMLYRQSDVWLTSSHAPPFENEEELNEWRLTALLFFYEILKSEGR